MPNANYSQAEYVKLLNLQPHPEGGYYTETYRSDEVVSLKSFNGSRNISTGIYYLLEKGTFSAFHRIKSDEMWHFYDGTDLSVYILDQQGALEVIRLGRNIGNGEKLQAVVPAGCWFASRVESEDGLALVGCTVSPGFDFKDFEMGNRNDLIQKFPEHSELIKSLTR